MWYFIVLSFNFLKDFKRADFKNKKQFLTLFAPNVDLKNSYMNSEAPPNLNQPPHLATPIQ